MTWGKQSRKSRRIMPRSLVLQAGGTVTPAAEAAFQPSTESRPWQRDRPLLPCHGRHARPANRARRSTCLQALLADMPADSPLRADRSDRTSPRRRYAAGIPVPALAKGAARPASGPDARRRRLGGEDARRAAAGDGPRHGRQPGGEAGRPTRGNLDGWLRLGRAYAVLHQPDKAADAYDKAAALKPGRRLDPVAGSARALLRDHAPTDKLPPRVIGLLKHVEATDPERAPGAVVPGHGRGSGRRPDERAALLEQTADEVAARQRGREND